MHFSTHFFDAVCDYRYLLAREYPVKAMLQLVGDRYGLSAHERVMLYRGMATEQQITRRLSKKITEAPQHTVWTLDGFNVCRTVGSYLNGNPVFVGLDGFLRDVSELHRKKLKWEVLERAMERVLEFMAGQAPENIRIYFDTPISHSGKMCEMTRRKMTDHHLRGTAETVFSPDYELVHTQDGIICTADSNIIDRAGVPVFDLAHAVLQKFFSARVFSFPEALAGKGCDDKPQPFNRLS